MRYKEIKTYMLRKKYCIEEIKPSILLYALFLIFPLLFTRCEINVKGCDVSYYYSIILFGNIQDKKKIKETINVFMEIFC